MNHFQHIGAGWLKLEASSDGRGDLDLLRFTTGYGEKAFDREIHVPVDARDRIGRLMATIPGVAQMGNSEPIGLGRLVPHDRGIKVVSPDDRTKNRLFVQEIQRYIRRKTFVVLQFQIEV